MIRTLSPFFTKGKALELGCFEGETTRLYAEQFDDIIDPWDYLIPKRIRGLKEKYDLRTVYMQKRNRTILNEF